MAPRWGPRHSLAGAPRRRRGRGKSGGARAAKGGARGLGSPPACEAGPGRHLGGRVVVGRRAVLPKVDFHDLHDAAAPRLRSASHEPAGAAVLPAAARPRAETRWRHQLWMERPKRVRKGVWNLACCEGNRASAQDVGFQTPFRTAFYFEYDDDRLDTI